MRTGFYQLKKYIIIVTILGRDCIFNRTDRENYAKAAKINNYLACIPGTSFARFAVKTCTPRVIKETSNKKGQAI